MLLSGRAFLFFRLGHDGFGSVSGTEFGFGHGMIRGDCELIDGMGFGTCWAPQAKLGSTSRVGY
jgi:hypothetical protein